MVLERRTRLILLLLVQSIAILPGDLTRLDPIEVPALGRVAKLGEFYDVRTEQFLHLPIFKSHLNKSSTEITQNQATSLKFTLDNTFEEKFRLMGISAEMKISILSGLISLKASGSFFKDTKTSAKSGKASLIQTFSNVYEQVSLLDNSLQSNINFKFLSTIDATHVVVGIQWGGSVFISVEDSNEENQDVQQVQGELEAAVDHLKYILSSVSAGSTINLTDRDLGKFNKYSFTIDGDLVPKSVPQTILDALKFMKESPQLYLNANDGKGKPMKYHLLPLEGLRQFWDVQTDLTSLVNRIDAVTIHNCVRLFDEMNAVSQRINDVYDLVNKYQKYLSKKKIKEMSFLKSTFDIFSTELTANLSQLLIKVRSGQESISKLQDVLHNAATYHESWQKSNDPVLRRNIEEAEFVEALQKQNITMFDRDILLDRFLWENTNMDIYILFFNYDESIMSDRALRMLKFINDKRKSGSSDLSVATSYEFASRNKEIAKWNQTNKICVYRNGEMVFDNYPFGNRSNETLDPGTLSLKQIQKHLEDLEKRVNQNQGIPKGFIYVQLPHQPEPSVTWEGSQWTEISSEYAGLFFRTVGGDAAPFAEIQEGFAPSSRVTDAIIYNCDQEQIIYRRISLPSYKYSLPLGLTPNYIADEAWKNCIKFGSEEKTGEVRPKNTAVRIWKRI